MAEAGFEADAGGVVETQLPTGRRTHGVVRRGGSVLRPLGLPRQVGRPALRDEKRVPERRPWTESVHAYLRHLEAAGFDGAPRILGVHGGREELTFLDGQVPADPEWESGRGHRLPDYARSEAAFEYVRTWPLDAAGLAGALEFVAGELRWLHNVLPDLARAL